MFVYEKKRLFFTIWKIKENESYLQKRLILNCCGRIDAIHLSLALFRRQACHSQQFSRNQIISGALNVVIRELWQSPNGPAKTKNRKLGVKIAGIWLFLDFQTKSCFFLSTSKLVFHDRTKFVPAWLLMFLNSKRLWVSKSAKVKFSGNYWFHVGFRHKHFRSSSRNEK